MTVAPHRHGLDTNLPYSSYTTDEGGEDSHKHNVRVIAESGGFQDQKTSGPTMGYVGEDWSDENGPALPEAPPPAEGT